MGEVRQQKIKFEDLVFLEDNPRTITDEAFKILVKRIKDDPTFFENRSCLVNFTEGKYLCYAGFQRAHAAAKGLKWKEIPCMVENDVPLELMRKRAIYDNTHDGEWDAHFLGNWEFEVDELREMGVPEYVFGGFGHPANEMSEEELNMLEEFDPVGIAADVQRVVFIFDNKGRAEDWLKENVPDLTVKKKNMAWQVNLSTLFT
jgi:hypothetical protein